MLRSFSVPEARRSAKMKKRSAKAVAAAASPKTPSLQRQAKRKTTTSSSMPPLATAVDAPRPQPAAPLSPPWTRDSLSLAARTLAELEPQRLAPLIEKHGVPFEKLLPKTTKGKAKEDENADQGHHHHHFATLARAIVGQQVSGAAAATIYSRVVTACLFAEGMQGAGKRSMTGSSASTALAPEGLLAAPLPALRAAGLSERKASYLVGLAERFLDSGSSQSSLSERLDELAAAGDSETMISELVSVRGVGTWTAQMHVLFHAGGPDVLPTGDLGIKKGFAKLFGGKSGSGGGSGGGSEGDGGEGEEKKKKSKSPTLPSEAQMLSWAEPFRPYRSLLSYYLWRAASE